MRWPSLQTDARAVSGAGDKTLTVWNLAADETGRKYTEHAGEVYAVAITPDGRYAVSGAQDKTLKLWDLRRGEVEYTHMTHDTEVFAVAVTPDARRILYSGYDALHLWDIAGRTVVRTFRGHAGWIRAVAVAADGRLAVSGAHNGTLHVGIYTAVKPYINSTAMMGPSLPLQ